jgi:hypothetical protein
VEHLPADLCGGTCPPIIVAGIEYSLFGFFPLSSIRHLQSFFLSAIFYFSLEIGHFLLDIGYSPFCFYLPSSILNQPSFLYYPLSSILHPPSFFFFFHLPLSFPIQQWKLSKMPLSFKAVQPRYMENFGSFPKFSID